MSSSHLEQALTRHRSELLGFLRRHAGSAVLRFESPEDLMQGVFTRAIEAAEGFEERNDDSTRAWLFRLARNYLVDRNRHWLATKRRSGQVLRFEMSRSGESTPALDPMASQTSPSQFAMRREQLILAARAMNLLMDRDRDLVTWTAQGMSLSDQAERLGIGYDAAAKASQRAQNRFRDVYRLVLDGEVRD